MKRTLFALTLLPLLLLWVCRAAPEAPRSPEPLETPASADFQDPPIAIASGPCRPCAPEETTVPLPETESIRLTRWDGEALLEVWLFHDELQSFREALPELRGHQQEGWIPPENPWPVYGLSVSGVEADYEAAYCDGLWVDSLGNSLISGPDPAPLWERFGRRAEEASSPPAQRELALAGGVWDARFLVPAPAQEPSPKTPMTLEANNGVLSWTLQNRSGQTLSHGNGDAAQLDILLGQTWYVLPFLSGSHYAYTMEAYTLPPGGDYAGVLWQEPYGVLPSGTYRVRFSWRGDPVSGMAAAPVRLQGGVFLPL